MTNLLKSVATWIKNHLASISADTLGWITIVLLHCASIPALVAIFINETEQTIPTDMLIFVWAGLATSFFKSLIEKNFLYIGTNCLGFIAQSVIMAMILFK